MLERDCRKGKEATDAEMTRGIRLGRTSQRGRRACSGDGRAGGDSRQEDPGELRIVGKGVRGKPAENMGVGN